MSMLNTLFNYQALDTQTPRSRFDHDDDKAEIARQRQLFFDSIRSLEKHGKVALENLLKSGARPGEETAWPLVHGFLEKYLDQADDTIFECGQVKDRDCEEVERRSKTHRRNADSGVSFTSAVTESISPTNTRVVTPSEKSRSPTPDSKSRKSTLERISHQLRKIRSRPDIREPTKSKPPTTLSKKKSLSALVGGRSASSSSNEASFNVDEMRRQKMIWEANQRKKAAQSQATQVAQQPGDGVVLSQKKKGLQPKTAQVAPPGDAAGPNLQMGFAI